MRILLLVPKHLKKTEAFEENILNPDTQLPIFQPHNFWFDALRDLGHDVRIIIYSSNKPQLDYYSFLIKTLSEKFSLRKSLKPFLFILPLEKKQKEIIKLSKEFQPQIVILSGNTDNIFPETLILIKRMIRCKLVLFNGLSPVNLATKSEKIMAPYLDYVFTNDTFHAIDWLMLGAKQASTLPVSAIDPKVHKNYDLSADERYQLSSDVSFVGSFAPDTQFRDRIKVLESLTDFNLRIWTFDKTIIKANKKLKKFYAGQASGTKMFKIFSASKINLNLHGHTTCGEGGNLRTFEIAASGGFEIADRTDPNWFKIDKEIVLFKNVEDLKLKIRYYLKNTKERKEIASAGFARTTRDHTYYNRFSKVIKILNGA